MMNNEKLSKILENVQNLDKEILVKGYDILFGNKFHANWPFNNKYREIYSILVGNTMPCVEFKYWVCFIDFLLIEVNKLEKCQTDNTNETQLNFNLFVPLKFNFNPKDDITPIELAKCIIFFNKNSVMPYDVDMSESFMRHFDVY